MVLRTSHEMPSYYQTLQEEVDSKETTTPSNRSAIKDFLNINSKVESQVTKFLHKKIDKETSRRIM